MTTPTQNKYMVTFKTLLHIPVVKQLIFLAGIAGGVALGMMLYMQVKEPDYKPLDYRITQQNMGIVADTLDKSGITYKINDRDGIVYVDASDVQLAKIKLASAGVARDDSFNFSYLNDQTAIGGSQFLENARYLRALESDLARTINAIEGVTGTKVHIAMPQNNIFADESKRPTASVVVNLGAGLSSDKEKIRAIVQIVASSVPGLDPKDVAITDQFGHFLSGALEQDSIQNAEQLNYQNNLQAYYEKRIESIIAPLLSDNKVNVRVHASMDFTQQEEAKEEYDPDQHVVRSEQTVSEQISSGGASGAPGALSNTPPLTDSEKSSGGGGGGAGASGSGQSSGSSTDGKSENIKNYEIGKSVKYKKTTTPKITALSVAVVVDNDMVLNPETNKYEAQPLSQDKINKITELVKATIGFDEKRGDKVTVVNSKFNLPKEEKVADLPFWQQSWLWEAVKKVTGLGAGFIFLIILYRRLVNYMKTPPATAVSAPFLGHEDRNITPEMHELKQEQVKRLKEMAGREPDRVALILKNWVGK